MITKTALEIRKNFAKVRDIARCEPVAITRRGKVVAYMIPPHWMDRRPEVRNKSNGA